MSCHQDNLPRLPGQGLDVPTASVFLRAGLHFTSSIEDNLVTSVPHRERRSVEEGLCPTRCPRWVLLFA